MSDQNGESRFTMPSMEELAECANAGIIGMKAPGDEEPDTFMIGAHAEAYRDYLELSQELDKELPGDTNSHDVLIAVKDALTRHEGEGSIKVEIKVHAKKDQEDS